MVVVVVVVVGGGGSLSAEPFKDAQDVQHPSLPPGLSSRLAILTITNTTAKSETNNGIFKRVSRY